MDNPILSHLSLMTQRAVTYVKPLEAEANHQETGPCSQEGGLAKHAAQNHSFCHHCGTCHFILGRHDPWDGPVFFPRAYVTQASMGDELYSASFLYLNCRLFFWMCGVDPETAQTLKDDRRGSTSNFKFTKTMVFPLHNRALSVFKNQLFLQLRVGPDVLLLRGLGRESPLRPQAHVVSRTPFPCCLHNSPLFSSLQNLEVCVTL